MMHLRYEFHQLDYVQRFELWRSYNIDRHTFELSAVRRSHFDQSANLSQGFCLGTVYFIAKMLYSKQPGGGLMYAQQFAQTFCRPLVDRAAAASMLKSYYVVQQYTHADKAMPLAKCVRQLYAKFGAAFVALAQYETLVPPSVLNSTLVNSVLQKSPVFQNFLCIPPSFWFYNEHLFQTLTFPMRCIFFPFVAEIMDIQIRFYRRAILPTDRVELVRELFLHSLSKVIACPSDKFIVDELTAKLINIQEEVHVIYPTIDLERRLNDQVGALSHRSLTPHTCALNADKIYQVNYFVSLIAVGHDLPIWAHAICGWEIEEFIDDRHVIRTFLFDANFGLYELSYTPDEREKFGTELINYWKRVYIIPQGRTSCLLTCTFYSGVSD